MSLEVIRAGLVTQIQDFGRFGYQGQGVTHGGPMDEHAYLWANFLLGNHFTAPQLEITLGGFSARFTRAAMIALCGADMSARCEQRPLATWRSHYVEAGEVIEFRSPKAGMCCYLAIQGGFEIKAQLSSCSTVAREHLGGLHQNGEKLQSDDRLAYQSSPKGLLRWAPGEYVPAYSNKIKLRFIPNNTATGCHKGSLAQLLTQTFTITPQIDRMGYRLAGEPIRGIGTGIISQGISMGTIQIPNDGQPIVLMRDHQTMGGYPQAGCVAHMDIPLLAQGRPGDEVTFSPAVVSELEEELLVYQKFFGVDY